MASGQVNPLLRWTDRRRDLGGNVVRPPKDVWLVERWWGDQAPSGSPYFTVHQVFDNIFRRVLHHLGVPTERDVTRIETIGGGDPQTFVSAEPWSIAPVGGPRARADYVFRNTSLSQSPTLVAHHFGDIKLKLTAGAKAGARVGVASVGVNGSAELEAVVITAVDPIVRVGLLLPWGRDSVSLDAYVREQFEAIELVDTDEAMDAFRQLNDERLPTEAPADLSFRTSSEGRPIAEEQPVEFSIGVRAAKPCRTLIALQVEDLENSDLAASSELLELEVTDDLEILVHFDAQSAGAAPATASA